MAETSVYYYAAAATLGLTAPPSDTDPPSLPWGFLPPGFQRHVTGTFGTVKVDAGVCPVSEEVTWEMPLPVPKFWQFCVVVTLPIDLRESGFHRRDDHLDICAVRPRGCGGWPRRHRPKRNDPPQQWPRPEEIFTPDLQSWLNSRERCHIHTAGHLLAAIDTSARPRRLADPGWLSQPLELALKVADSLAPPPPVDDAEGSMPRSWSGQIVVPDDVLTQDAPVGVDDVPTQDAPVVPDDVPTQNAPVVPDDAASQRRVVAWWIAALGLTVVVGLTAWFVLARASGGSSTAHSPVGPSTRASSVPLSTEDPWARLTPGECFNYLSSATNFGHLSSTTNIAVVPCRQPHDAEAYYRYTLPGGFFPGNASMEDEAMPTCGARLAGYDGPFTDLPITPDRSQWAAGERVVVCALAQAGGKITGSARPTH